LFVSSGSGEAFVPVTFVAMKEEGTFLSLVMAMKRRVLSDRKVEMCFEKKNNYFYNI
jgi:hypothetical protein